MNKLLPCPFLNVEKDIGHNLYFKDDNGLTYIQCSCGASGPLSCGEELAIKAWNTRALTEISEGEVFEFFSNMRINSLGQKLIDVADIDRLKDDISLFFSKFGQPSVKLPERKQDYDFNGVSYVESITDWEEGWNAYHDKVIELNKE